MLTVELIDELYVVSGQIASTGQKVYWEGFEDRETAEAVAVLSSAETGELRMRLGYSVDSSTGKRVQERITWVSEKTRRAKLAEIRQSIQESR